MSAPVLTVRHNGAPSSFAPGHDVVVGRDLRADIRIPHPLISRAHVVLRFDRGRWTAIDNGSLNGMYVNGRRVPEVDIADGSVIALGNPDGPVLQFETGRHQGAVGRPPQTSTVLIPPNRPDTRPPRQPYPPEQTYPPEPPYPPQPLLPTQPPSYQTPSFPPYAPPPIRIVSMLVIAGLGVLVMVQVGSLASTASVR